MLHRFGVAVRTSAQRRVKEPRFDSWCTFVDASMNRVENLKFRKGSEVEGEGD